MKRSYRIPAVVMALAIFVAATALDAQAGRRDQRGFQLYLGLGNQEYEIEDKDYAELDQFSDEQLGFIGAGIGLNDELLLFLEAAGSEHTAEIGEVTFGYVHLGLKYAPSVGRKWQLYGKGSVGGVFLVEENNRFWHDHHHGDDDERGYAGPSIGLAIGLDRYVSRRAAIFGELGWIGGKFDHRFIGDDDFELRDDIELKSGRAQFGIRFRL